MATKKIDLKISGKAWSPTQPKKGVGTKTIEQIRASMGLNANNANTPRLTTSQKRYAAETGFKTRTLPQNRYESPTTDFIGGAIDFINRPMSGVLNYLNRQAIDVGNAVFNNDIGAGLRAGAKALFPILGAGDFAEGMTDKRVSGENLIDTVLDRPQVQSGLKQSGLQTFANNPVIRAGAGLATEIAADPLTYISIGQIAKATKLDDVLKPIGKAITDSPQLGNALKKLGIGLPKEYKAATAIARKGEAAGDDIAMVLKEVMEGTTKVDSKKYKQMKDVLAFATQASDNAPGVFQKLSGSIDNLAKELDNLEATTKLPRKEIMNMVQSAVSKEVIDPRFDKAAKAWGEMMDTVGGELVAKGLISPEQVSDFGTYFHKVYNQSQAIADPNIITKQGGIKMGEAGDILKQDISDAERILELKQKAMVGEDKQAWSYLKKAFNQYREDYLPTKASDMAIRDTIDKFPGFDAFGYAGEARKAAGLVTDRASDVFANTVQKQFKVMATDRLYKQLGQYAVEPSNTAKVGELLQRGYKQLSNSPDFGALAGKYMPGYMVDDLEGILSPKIGWMDKALGWWKKGKLFSPGNFATPLRNNISNIMLNSVVEDGLPVYRMDIYAQALSELKNGGRYLSEFKQAGGGLTGVMKSEIDVIGKQAGVGSKLDRIFKPMMNVQAGSEELAKLSQFIWQRKKGKTVEEALRIAEKATFDYSTVPNLVRQFGNNFMPFISFKYLATELAVDTLINRTGKLTVYDKGKRAIENITAEEEGQPLPQWMQDNRTMQMRTPFTDEQGNRLFQDWTYMFPFGDITGGYNMADLALGNPFLRAAVELGSGQNLYYNQPITDSNLPDEQWKDRVKYLVQNIGPATPLMPGSRQQDKLLSAGKPDKYGNVRNTSSALLDVFGGIKLKSIDYKKQGELNKLKNKSNINSIKSEITKTKKDESLSDREKEEKIKKLELMLQELQ
jgi:hypothetical protein